MIRHDKSHFLYQLALSVADGGISSSVQQPGSHGQPDQLPRLKCLNEHSVFTKATERRQSCSMCRQCTQSCFLSLGCNGLDAIEWRRQSCVVPPCCRKYQWGATAHLGHVSAHVAIPKQTSAGTEQMATFWDQRHLSIELPARSKHIF